MVWLISTFPLLGLEQIVMRPISVSAREFGDKYHRHAASTQSFIVFDRTVGAHEPFRHLCLSNSVFVQYHRYWLGSDFQSDRADYFKGNQAVIQDFLNKVVAVYQFEIERQTAISPVLSHLLDVESDSQSTCISDRSSAGQRQKRSWSLPDQAFWRQSSQSGSSRSARATTAAKRGDREQLVLIVEYKNEFGNPLPQSALSYYLNWLNLNEDCKLARVAPGFIVCIAGPMLTIAGVFFNAGRVNTSIIYQRSLQSATLISPRDHMELAAALFALRRCLALLLTTDAGFDYDGTKSLTVPFIQHAEQIPSSGDFIPSFLPSPLELGQSRDYLQFQLSELLVEDKWNIFLAQQGNQTVVVKFVWQYNVEAHRMLAKAGHAPQLLGFSRLSDQLSVVVMEYLGGDRFCSINDAPSHVLDDLQDMLKSNQVFHGDIRSPNILFDKDAQRAVLLDFDWAATSGCPRVYPACLNLTAFPDDFRPGDVITHDHDRTMIEKLKQALRETNGQGTDP